MTFRAVMLDHSCYSAADLSEIISDFAKECGSGAFGTVYCGYDSKRSRKVAAKVLHEGSDAAASLGDMFDTELRILLSLSHPNIVSSLGVCRERPALVYAFVEHGSLSQILEQFSEWSLALDAMHDISKGLAFLHSHEPPLIHRDVTDTNVLVDSFKRCLLGDFGVAKLCPEISVGKTHVTTRVLGTPGYFDPHYLNTGHLTTQVDIFACGVIVFQLLCHKKAIHEGEPLRDFLVDAREDGACIKSLIALSGVLDVALVNKVWEIAHDSTCRKPKSRPSADRLCEDFQVIAAAAQNAKRLEDARRLPQQTWQTDAGALESSAESEHVCELIDSIAKCVSTVKDLQNAPEIGFHIIGADGREGPVSLLQIANSLGYVYLFDIAALGADVFTQGHLGTLLESEVCKLVFDGRRTADALAHIYGITVKCVYDIQVLDGLRNPESHPLGSLADCLHIAQVMQTEDIEAMVESQMRLLGDVRGSRRDPQRNCEDQGNMHILTSRPMEPWLVALATNQVMFLTQMKRNWASPALDELVLEYSTKRIQLIVQAADRPYIGKRDFPGIEVGDIAPVPRQRFFEHPRVARQLGREHLDHARMRSRSSSSLSSRPSSLDGRCRAADMYEIINGGGREFLFGGVSDDWWEYCDICGISQGRSS